MTTTATQSRLVGQPPRVLSWPQFDSEARRTVKQGDHQLFVGPTQSGKTVLCRVLVRHRGFVVVWGMKKRDVSLDAYLEEGYIRVDEWPPRSQIEIRPNGTIRRKNFNMDRHYQEMGEVHVLLWPQIKERRDIPRHRQVYLDCLNDTFKNGGWTIVIDEMLWATRRTGLDLNSPLAETAFSAASDKVSLYMCMQRPSGMERVTWSSVSDAYVFKSGVIDDIRELAALGTNDPRDAVKVIQTQIKGHRFLHLPTRGQSRGWAISEVDPSVI